MGERGGSLVNMDSKETMRKSYSCSCHGISEELASALDVGWGF
jgi:hypothetical protein